MVNVWLGFAAIGQTFCVFKIRCDGSSSTWEIAQPTESVTRETAERPNWRLMDWRRMTRIIPFLVSLLLLMTKITHVM